MSVLSGTDVNSGYRDEIKAQFYLPEGAYRQVLLADVLKANRNQQTSPQSPQTASATAASLSAPVQLSFCTYRPTSRTRHKNEGTRGDESEDAQPDEMELVCFNYYRELYTYSVPCRNSHRTSDYVCRDKRSYKGTYPTSHEFNRFLATRDENPRVLLAVGFSMGQIQVVDPIEKDPTKSLNKLFNEDRSIEKSRVTCIRWVPNSTSHFLVAHASGQLYLYTEELSCSQTPPHYQLLKTGEQFSVHSCKSKVSRNPIYRWCIGCTHFTSVGLAYAVSDSQSSQKGGTIRLFNGSNVKDTDANLTANSSGAQLCNSAGQLDATLTGNGVMQALQSGTLQAPSTAAVHAIAFSPCGRFLAAVSADGRLRVFDYKEMQLIGSMRSYFGALLCCSWSPDSRLVAVGGEDDLIGVWSLVERRVLCRAQGHRSWVTRVSFDPYLRMSSSASGYGVEEVQSFRSNDQHVILRRNPTLSQTNDQRESETSTESQRKRVSSLSVTSPSSSGAQPLYYRFGSVGQDTLICFWELIIDDPVYSNDGTSSVADTSASDSLIASDPHAAPYWWRPWKSGLTSESVVTSGTNSVSGPDRSAANTNGKRSVKKSKDTRQQIASASNRNNGITLQRFVSLAGATDKSQSTFTSSANDTTQPDRRASNESYDHELEANKKSQRKTNGTDRSKRDRDFKRFFSISWGRKDNVLQQNGSHRKSASGSLQFRNNHVSPSSAITPVDLNVNVSILENEQPVEMPMQLTSPYTHSSAPQSQSTANRRSSSPSTSGYGSALGTPSCPRLEQVPILEPLTCKKIAYDRLSDLVFRQDCVLTACHDCVITAWLRPGRSPRGARLERSSTRSETMDNGISHLNGFDSSGSNQNIEQFNSDATDHAAASFTQERSRFDHQPCHASSNTHSDESAPMTVHTFASNEIPQLYNRNAASRINSKSATPASVFGTQVMSPYAAYSFK